MQGGIVRKKNTCLALEYKGMPRLILGFSKKIDLNIQGYKAKILTVGNLGITMKILLLFLLWIIVRYIE